MAPTIAAPTSSVSKSAQVTFGLLLIAVAAIAFWEELTDSRLLRVVATPEEATPAQFKSLHEYWDKYEDGKLEEWDIDMAPGELEKRMHEDMLDYDMLNEEDLEEEEMVWDEAADSRQGVDLDAEEEEAEEEGTPDVLDAAVVDEDGVTDFAT